MKNILVTGGSGFVGSHVINNLVKNKKEVITVDVLDNNTSFSDISDEERLKNKKFREKIRNGVSEYFLVDTNNYDSMIDIISLKKYDIIIHLAAMPLATVAIEYPSKAFEAIVSGTQNLLECIRLTSPKSKIIYVSSSMVYGDFVRNGLAYETDPCSPKEIYGSLKYAGEIIVSAYAKRYSINSAICRPSAVYGPGDDNKRVIQCLLNNALNGKIMKVYNGAETFLDFTYVDDLAKSIVAVALVDKILVAEIFNVTRGKARSLLEVAQMIQKIVPNSIIEETQNKEDFRPKRGTLSSTKLEKEIGYVAKVDIEEGLPLYRRFMCNE